MVRIASCEDNPAIRDSLKNSFEQLVKEENLDLSVDFFVNGEQLLGAQKPDYDIYILDINMGPCNLNGMELARTIRDFDEQALIIFLTTEKKYIKEGYQVRAYRYLTKPIAYLELKFHIISAVSDIERQRDNYIDLTGKYSKYNKIKIDDIYYIETSGRKTLVHTRKGDIECLDPISILTEKLENKGFFRCNNSYLINLSYVKKVDCRTVEIEDQQLLVTRSKVKPLRDALTAYDNNH